MNINTNSRIKAVSGAGLVGRKTGRAITEGDLAGMENIMAVEGLGVLSMDIMEVEGLVASMVALVDRVGRGGIRAVVGDLEGQVVGRVGLGAREGGGRCFC
jgi:hypothetical protein